MPFYQVKIFNPDGTLKKVVSKQEIQDQWDLSKYGKKFPKKKFKPEEEKICGYYKCTITIFGRHKKYCGTPHRKKQYRIEQKEKYANQK